MVIHVSDKKENYSNVSKLLVKLDLFNFAKITQNRSIYK